MYSETLKNNSNKAILVIVFALIFLSGIVIIGYLPTYPAVKDILKIIFLSILAYIIIKYFVNEFCYEATETEFIIRKNPGRRNDIVAQINIEAIKIIAPKKHSEILSFKVKPSLSATLVLGKKMTVYSIVFELEGQFIKIDFQPSNELLNFFIKKGIKVVK